MDTDQESLLGPSGDRRNTFMGPISSKIYGNGNGSPTRWRKNSLLLLIVLLIATCFSVYIYLNIAIDQTQTDTSRYKPLSRRKPMLDHESIFSDSGPSMIKLSDLLAHCIVALRVAGREVVNLSLANNDKLHQLGSKGKTLEGADDVVTGADLKSHHMIINTIKDSYRRLKVVSEEDSTKEFENTGAEDDILPINRTEFAKLLRGDLHDIEGDHVDRGSLIAQQDTLIWIDPLDATKEYSENLTDYVTLMACVVHKSKPIAGVIFKPFTNETFWSIMDLPTGKYHHSPDLRDAIKSGSQTSGVDRGMSGSDRNQSADKGLKIIVSRSHAGDVKNVLKNAYADVPEIVSAGGSGYKTIEVIRGKVDAYIHLTRIKKWDICAPDAILSSIEGGKLTDLDGLPIGFGAPKETVVTKGLIASINHVIHKQLIGLSIGSSVERN